MSWDKLADLFQHCRAFVFPGLEDFGIAPLEAQAAGRPVIAYAAGGALDTIVNGETGLLFQRANSSGPDRGRSHVRNPATQPGGLPPQRRALRGRSLPP